MYIRIRTQTHIHRHINIHAHTHIHIQRNLRFWAPGRPRAAQANRSPTRRPRRLWESGRPRAAHASRTPTKRHLRCRESGRPRAAQTSRNPTTKRHLRFGRPGGPERPMPAGLRPSDIWAAPGGPSQPDRIQGTFTIWAPGRPWAAQASRTPTERHLRFWQSGRPRAAFSPMELCYSMGVVHLAASLFHVSNRSYCCIFRASYMRTIVHGTPIRRGKL